jgi:hypothetical protein
MVENVDGQIQVRFMRGFDPDNIRELIKRTGLEIKDLSGSACILEVPEGTETEWIDRFNAMDPVNIADRVRVYPLPDSRPHLAG